MLRPDEATTLRRATSRTATDALTDPEPNRSDPLHHQFSSLGTLEPHVLNSSNMDPATTAEAALRGITNNYYRLS